MKFPADSPWLQAYTILASCLVLLIVLFWATAASIVDLWSKNPLSHGYLVIPTACYLAWIRRGTYEASRPGAAFWALLPLGGAASLWFLGTLTGSPFIQQLCF